MDSYAAGSVPIFGWADMAAGDRIEVNLDGERLGEVRYLLSRMDVYDALPYLAGSDVGFHYELEYKHLDPSAHVIHVVVRRADGQCFLLGRRTMRIPGRTAVAGRGHPNFDHLPPMAGAGLTGCLDHPADGQLLLYNPFAAEWQRFQELQVSNLLAHFTRIAVESGLGSNQDLLPPDRLVSRRIMELCRVRSACRRALVRRACPVSISTAAPHVLPLAAAVTVCPNSMREWVSRSPERYFGAHSNFIARMAPHSCARIFYGDWPEGVCRTEPGWGYADRSAESRA